MKNLSSLLGIELGMVSPMEKVVSVLGGLVSISLLMWVTRQFLAPESAFPVIASMGASAVLLFAVPHGPLSQPWPVLAGHGVSAVIGVLCARHLGHGWLAAGCAVGLAIGAMHQLRCIHPPGGATALTAVIGGEAVQRLGFQFVAWPVLANAAVVLGVAVAFNWPFTWRRYPAVLSRRRGSPGPPRPDDEASHAAIVQALKSIDSFIDVSEPDLRALAQVIAREREARSDVPRRDR